jgi:hypothetical protein
MDTPGLLKLRLFVARNRRVVIAALVVVAVVSTAGAGWAYANPGTETDTEQRYPQTVSSAADTRTVVQGETALYDQGTTLVNRQVYPFDASPTLTLAASVDAPDGTRVDQRLVVRYRAVRDDEVVWSETRVLATTAGNVGEAGTLQAAVNVTRVRERLTAVRSEFSGAAAVDVELGHVATYETDRYEGSLNASVPLGFTRNAYIVDGRLAAERDHSTATSVTTRQSPNVPLVGGLALVGLVAGAAAAVLVRNPPSVATTTDELQRRRYAEWISSGRLPVYAADRYVEMSTLADLVNVAVDSNRRVIHDGELDAYGIIDEDALYWYARGDDDLLGLAVPFEGAGEGRGARGARMGIEGFEGAEADAEGDADVPPGFERLEAGDDGGSAEGDDGNDDPEDLFDDL